MIYGFRLRHQAIVIAASTCVVACAQGSQEVGSWSDMSPHESFFVEANGTRLHVLDWGGNGEDLILIHGASQTAHYFDDIAPALTDRFRVVAFSRRGHGQSEIPTEEFSLDVLVEDLRQLMDSLDIVVANMLGHSFAGNEITRFAALYPERVQKLVFLDAHYEGVESPWVAADQERPPGRCRGPTINSIADRRACMAVSLGGIGWPDAMEANLRDMVVEGSANPLRFKIEGQTVAASSMGAIYASYRREYDRLNNPVLVLLADSMVTQTATDSAWDRRVGEWHERMFVPAREWTINRFRQAIPDVKIVVLPGTNHGGIVAQNTDRLLRELRGFLIGSNSARL